MRGADHRTPREAAAGGWATAPANAGPAAGASEAISAGGRTSVSEDGARADRQRGSLPQRSEEATPGVGEGIGRQRAGGHTKDLAWPPARVCLAGYTGGGR